MCIFKGVDSQGNEVTTFEEPEVDTSIPSKEECVSLITRQSLCNMVRTFHNAFNLMESLPSKFIQ